MGQTLIHSSCVVSLIVCPRKQEVSEVDLPPSRMEKLLDREAWVNWQTWASISATKSCNILEKKRFAKTLTFWLAVCEFCCGHVSTQKSLQRLSLYSRQITQQNQPRRIYTVHNRSKILEGSWNLMKRKSTNDNFSFHGLGLRVGTQLALFRATRTLRVTPQTPWHQD